MAINTISKNMGISLEAACHVMGTSMEKYQEMERIVKQEKDE